MRPGSRQAQVVARTGWCGEGVGSEDARTWKSRLLSSKSHLNYPQHCSCRGTTGSECASGARPPKRRLWRIFLLFPYLGSLQSVLGLGSSAARPSTCAPTPSPTSKSAGTGGQSVELPDSWLSALPLPPPSVVTGGSGGPGAAGLERAPLRADVECL